MTQTISSLSSKPILEVDNISKNFGTVKAIKDISITIKSGEILAILGENGAGKSTLMKILAGLHQPDGGSISIDPTWFKDGLDTSGLIKTSLKNPRFSMNLGIGMVYQHFQLVEEFTVAENIVLGKEFTHRGTVLLNPKKANQEIEALGKSFGLPIDPSAKVADLAVGLKQRVEILKQLFRDAKLMILDEPTAVLTPSEVVELFKTMRELKEAGKAIIFIYHKLNEPLEIADRIVIMRDGEMAGEVLPNEVNKEQL
ncbi:MAG: ATP-binding cassette domain-containing protein, partial [Candidatus Heimdallarchaeota archaeon]|nr:ATP-binding cassette domain-containing protein [Candidatus Heimdallarchaeota archaeon]